MLLVCAAASCFFALAEASLLTLGDWRARALAERDPARGGWVVRLLRTRGDLLATIVLGNTVSNAFIVALGWTLMPGTAWSVALTLLLLVGTVLLLCDVAPKTLALRSPDAWALRVARPMGWVQAWAKPVRTVAQGCVDSALRFLRIDQLRPMAEVTDAEYSDLVELAAQQGALGMGEKEIILRIISLDQRLARDVMKPRSQMVVLSDDLPPDELLQAARKARHHRIPLEDPETDSIVGVLNTRTLLLGGGVDLAEAVEFPSFVPETMNLLRLFEALQRQQRGMAIVLDEFGGTAGLVTLQDILEAVIGRIRPEGGDEEFLFEKLGPGRWRASGSMRLDDFRREHPALEDDPDVDTLGGLVVKLAEMVPAVGEVLVHRGLRFTVRSADERRVREVEVEKAGSREGRGE